MKLADQRLIKALFISCLVVALAAIKSKLEHRFQNLDVLLYFFLFLISLFVLSIIEFVFEKLDEASWFGRVFAKRGYIYGWWLNYAVDRESGSIYNYALIKIERASDQIHLDGTTFKVSGDGADQLLIIPDGHFLSTIAQYQSELGLLGFNFTIDSSEKVTIAKHKIFGNAEYFFERSDNIPKTFTGEFSTETPSTFCYVIGHRLDERAFVTDEALVERYRSIIGMALQRKWIDIGQISGATREARANAELITLKLRDPRA